ncbi:hypothetical protein K435DRAFT_781599 [Dendrothele bispora CBS 962.96]|uniref:Pheromone n=1 Tax=Dendrothele bispora (strain CBS 962.96) TaxID=1314807 RepID=A0A4S8LK74_DENBC|nr:hypothetical protein K435DRAFT_781599 [Dendrothele bispora CBS 962.96]
MDSFTSITAYFVSGLPTAEQPMPVDQEKKGGGSNVYCVVTKVEDVPGTAPVDQEGSGGGSNVYCVVA